MHTLHRSPLLKLLSFTCLFFAPFLATAPAFGVDLLEDDFQNLVSEATKLLRYTNDFPAPGITFITLDLLVANAQLSKGIVDEFAAKIQKIPGVNAIAGISTRGWLFGPPIAYKLGIPFVPIHKNGAKIPPHLLVSSTGYSSEYEGNEGLVAVKGIASSCSVENPGAFIFDDVMATGGTFNAAMIVLQKLGFKTVGCGSVLQIFGLGGKERLIQAGIDPNNIITLLN